MIQKRKRVVQLEEGATMRQINKQISYLNLYISNEEKTNMCAEGFFLSIIKQKHEKM
jgi:hypothetical protein